nr:hypothetical protein [Tanacetum cinerariifolium]
MLKEGGIFLIKNFVVRPNKDEFRVFRHDLFMLEFHCSTTIRKVSANGVGFVRYTFQLVDFDDIELTNNNYMIDVSGYVTNVGRISHMKFGSKTLAFYLADQSLVKPKKEMMMADSSQPREGTIENLLLWAKNRKNDTVTFQSKVMIEDIRRKSGWNYPSCGGEKCRKSVSRKARKFLCETCNKTVDYPVLRYRLEVVVADDTAHTVIVMFNEVATELLNCSANSFMEAEDEDDSSLPTAIRNLNGTTHVMELKSHTYYEYGSYESFTYWKINPADLVADEASFSNQLITIDDLEPSFKRLSRQPSVCTPSKLNEEKRKKAKDPHEINADGPVNKKKRKMCIDEDLDSV